VVDAFNEGVNVPSVGLVAFCRVTDSVTVFRQQLGRGLRPGKEKLIVLDFVGNLERIRLILAMVEKIKGFGTPRGPLDKRLNEKFEVSGAGFQFTFSDEIVDLMGVLQHVDEKFYETWEEAAEAARRLEIKTSTEYFSQEKYKQDERLPASPARFYSDFPGWTKLFEDPVIAEAIVNRLEHPSQRLNLKGGSYREKLQTKLPAGKRLEAEQLLS
jgi:hypothetical protein